MNRHSEILKSVALSLLLSLSAGALSVRLPAEARGKFEKATVDPAETNMKQGMEQVRVGNYEAATDSFMQAIYFSRNRYNPEAYKMLGLCYKAQRNYPKAIQALLDHLSQTTEQAADARIDLAECYINTGQIDKARDEINKSFSENPYNKGTWRQRYAQGELAEKMDDPGQAIAFYTNAIDEKQNYADAWMGRARCYVKTERYNDALRDYRTMLEKSLSMRGLDLSELYYNMGTCLYKRGDHQGALDHWRLCLEQVPDHYDAHLALAHMLDEEKHISSAVKEYQAALSAFPKYGTPATKQTIEKRLMWLENQLAPKDTPSEVKPSPSMRRDFDETERRRPTMDQAPMPKESGF